jgi:phage-related minor tail protein
MTKRIEREQQLLQVRGQARTLLEAEFALRDALESAEVSYSEAALQRAAAEIAAGNEKIAMLQQQEALAQKLEKSFEDFFMSLADGTSSTKDAFRSMARQILSELYRVLVVQQLVGSFSQGGGGILGAIFSSFNAKGNAFSGGNVVPFALGGVVNGPTAFPMSGGRTGLMGEAGPEAIMPLKRGRDGSLGVVAEGGGGTVVNQSFSFNLAANGDESVKQIVAQAAPQIVEAAKAGVLDARRRGGAYRAAFG